MHTNKSIIITISVIAFGLAGLVNAVPSSAQGIVPPFSGVVHPTTHHLSMQRPVWDILIERMCDRRQGRIFLPLNFCAPEEPLPVCGDGVMNQESEQCDGTDGVSAHYQCTNQCQLAYVPYCGDGVINQFSEQCDGDAGIGEGEVCNGQCMIEIPSPAAVCGNGVQEEDEQCDGVDGVGEGQQCTAQCLLQDIPPAGEARVVINEVLVNPSEAQGVDANEWVELYNAGTAAADLTSWSINDASGDPVVIPGNLLLAPGAFLLITPSDELDSFWVVPEGAQVVTINIGGLTNSGGDKVVLFDETNAVVDQVSYGSNIDAFDPSTPLPGDGKSLSRSPNGIDTDTADDWVILDTPMPGM